jgi:hypothetical protein
MEMGQDGRPTQVHTDLIRSPLRTCGSSCHFALCPLQLRHFGDDILTSKIEGLLAWSSVFYSSILGIFLCNTSVLATFGSDFIMHLNTNRTPHLLFWTCDSILLVHVFLYLDFILTMYLLLFSLRVWTMFIAKHRGPFRKTIQWVTNFSVRIPNNNFRLGIFKMYNTNIS